MSIDFDEITLILSGVKILQDLDIEVIHDIAKHTQVASFEKDEMVVKAGDMGERIYFIFEGKVEVQIPDVHGDIKSRIMLKKGEVVGEISLLINSTYSADILALSQTTAFYLDQKHFNEIIEKHPDFAEVMSQLMTSRMAQNGGINRVGKYELRSKLGEGNMATVFNAWDPELEREVAIRCSSTSLHSMKDFCINSNRKRELLRVLTTRTSFMFSRLSTRFRRVSSLWRNCMGRISRQF